MVAEQSRALLHGTGGPRLNSRLRQVPSFFSGRVQSIDGYKAGFHQFLRGDRKWSKIWGDGKLEDKEMDSEVRFDPLTS